MLAETHSDKEGNFELHGKENEIGSIRVSFPLSEISHRYWPNFQPYLRITHNCDTKDRAGRPRRLPRSPRRCCRCRWTYATWSRLGSFLPSLYRFLNEFQGSAAG